VSKKTTTEIIKIIIKIIKARAKIHFGASKRKTVDTAYVAGSEDLSSTLKVKTNIVYTGSGQDQAREKERKRIALFV